MATVHEGPLPGIYAQTLERIYEINQVPAVLAGVLTHPNLYDRMLAAGVTPGYPRPAAPARITWLYGVAIVLFAVSVGTLAVTRIEREHQKRWPAMHGR